MVSPVRVVCVVVLALVGGLYWPTTLACSAIKSLIEGAVGQCSPW